MADTKFSAFTPLSVIAGDELLVGIPSDNSDNIKVVIDDLKRYISPIRQITRTLSSAEILSLFTSPVTLVSAPGSGKAIHVLNACVKLVYGTTTYTAGATVRIGVGSYIPAISFSSILSGTADGISFGIASSYTQSGSDGVSNQPLIVKGTVDELNGDSTLKITVNYAIATT